MSKNPKILAASPRSIKKLSERGQGNRRTVSTSNTRNRTANVKKYIENGVRDPFNWSSNPHSIGFILSLWNLERGEIKLRRESPPKITAGKIVEIRNICQNIYEGAPSGTPTMLRLISPFGESDGRFVHTSEHYSK